MRKIVAFFFAFLIFVASVDAAVVRPLPVGPAPAQTGVTASPLNSMSVKELQQRTGKKLNVVQRMAYKAMQKARKASAEGKSQLVAVLLAWFVGFLGIHRFYLGYTWQGIVQLLTLGGLGIWALIDFIRILTGDLKPKNAEYAEKL